MHFRYALVAVFAVWLSGGEAHADACSKDNTLKSTGQCWNSLAPTLKSYIIWGMWSGKDARVLADTLIGQEPSYFLAEDYVGTPPETTIGDIVKYFDTLYQTPANRSILWSQAYLLAAMAARDDDSNDRLNLLKMFREGRSPPTYGKIVDLKSANTVIVESGNNRYEIVLAGTTTENVPAPIRERAKDFIRGFSRAGWADCNKTNDAMVSISYPEDFFGSDNKLNGYVKETTGYGVCLGTQFIRYAEITGHDVDKVLLNTVMIQKGLLRPQESTDAKWSKSKITTRELLALSQKEAKDKSLYVYGGKSDPFVELLSSPDQARVKLLHQ